MPEIESFLKKGKRRTSLSSTKLPFADKKLGQHFLREQKYIQKITNDFKDQDCCIVEVGPGPAILTPSLASHGKEFYVVEKDERFYDRLKEYVNEDHIILGDALEQDFNWEGPLWLVSNLPYNVSVPLIIKFTQRENIQWMTLMVQKEVGERMLAPQSSKGNDRGSLMCLVQNYFDIKLLCHVPPGAFVPPPKVDSVVLSFTRKAKPEIALDSFKKFEEFCRILFSNRRKQVGKVLKSKYEKERIERAFQKCGLELTRRAETFTQEEVCSVYKEFHGN